MTSYIPQMLSPTTIWQFVASFPQAAASSYALLGHWTSALTGLTPKARQNVHKILALFYRMLLWFWQYAVIVYAYLMHSSKSPLDWEPPAAFLLGTVTRLALFFAPVVDEWEAVDKNKGSKPYLFISNRNVYALDGLPMVAAIYRQTGIWPRFAADTYFFKIPLLKQFLEHFGAFPADKRIAGKLLEKGQSVVMSPGGFNETLKRKDSSMDYTTASWTDLELPEEGSFVIVPVSSIGPNDMFDHFYDLDLSPALWLCGYKNMKQSIPILYFKSYERSYMLFSRPVELEVVPDVKEVVQKGLNKVRSTRAQDPGRYLMTKMGIVLKRGNQWILENVLHSEQLRNLTWKSSQKVLTMARNWLETVEL